MTSAGSYEIKIPQFEGPFDLLLFFIERDELDIHLISIAGITDDFLDYIHKMNLLNIELASEFILVAATLMRIKARMLLPRFAANEEGSELDMQQELIRRLVEYKKFKQLAEEFKLLEEQRFRQEKRGSIQEDHRLSALQGTPGEELNSFDLYKLMMVYHRVISAYKNTSETITHTVIQYPYSIEQQKKVIAELLAINKRLDFQTVLKHSENKVHFVYNFLAILEMLQQRLVEIQSGLGYNNFFVVRNDSLTPNPSL